MKFLVEQLKEKTSEQRLMAVQNYRLFKTTTKHHSIPQFNQHLRLLLRSRKSNSNELTKLLPFRVF